MPIGIYKRKTLAERFWPKVQKGPECWLWSGCRGGSLHRYGKIQYDGKDVLTHRISWLLHFGPIPDGLCVLHKCDVTLCVNPLHLFLGTNNDNIKDKIKKGRQAQKESHPLVKLSVADVEEIRKLYQTGKYSQYDLSDRFGVVQQQISRIINHKRWS